jgi:hypothetical protein
VPHPIKKKRKEEVKARVSPPPPSVPSVVPVVPPAKSVRDILIYSFWSQSVVPLAVRDGHTTFGVDRKGETVVVAIVVIRWRKRRKERIAEGLSPCSLWLL